MNPIMNIRTFLKGGYRELEGPTTVISGQTPIFTAVPFGEAPRPAHPEPEGAGTPSVEGWPVPETAGERTEAPSLGRAVSSAGRSRHRSPVRRSVQAMLDQAAKEGRG